MNRGEAKALEAMTDLEKLIQQRDRYHVRATKLAACLGEALRYAWVTMDKEKPAPSQARVNAKALLAQLDTETR